MKACARSPRDATRPTGENERGPKMSAHPLAPIFEPRSVGVIGASADPGKRGHQVVAALQRSGFSGPVYPVNPRGGEILGLEVAREVGEIETPPDLVYIATPAGAVPDVVAACGRAGVKGAIVPAVGFRESGEDGAELERRLVAAARETGIRVIGPNTSGLLNTHIGLHMVGGEPLAPGHLAIVSQSGNVALDLMTSAAARPIGVSIDVGPGNESDVGFHEILDFLAGHEPTRAIILYMEGVRDGRALYETARRVTAVKPIVVLKGGRSDAGERAAKSHTGSVAGSYAVFRAIARQGGMIEVEASDELLPVGEALALQPTPPLQPTTPAMDGGAGFVVISDGGGHATLAADRFASLGVPLAHLRSETRKALRGLLGPAASARNPVDVAGAPPTARRPSWSGPSRSPRPTRPAPVSSSRDSSGGTPFGSPRASPTRNAPPRTGWPPPRGRPECRSTGPSRSRPRAVRRWRAGRPGRRRQSRTQRPSRSRRPSHSRPLPRSRPPASGCPRSSAATRPRSARCRTSTVPASSRSSPGRCPIRPMPGRCGWGYRIDAS